jgi:hypothetical protein
MLRTLQIAPGFGASRWPAGGIRHPVQTTTRWLRQAAAALRMTGEAWDECIAAHRQYWQLMSRGVPHRTAVREALGFGPAPAHDRLDPAKPLGFAGRA